MKIVCDACQAKYSISDDKVQGKVFKIRCKKCSNIIVVRGGAAAAEPAPAPAQEKDTRVYDYGYEGGGDQQPAGDEAVWHVVINQDQVGPMTAVEVQQRFSSGEIDAETYAWREGFPDWLPLSQVDAFAEFVASNGATASASSSGAGAAAVAAMFGGGGGEEAGTVRSDPGDLFAAASAGSSRHTADDDGGDLFGSKPVAASAAAASSSAANSKLRGERNENSVLFSLNNLAQLASDRPAPSSSSSSAASAGGGGATMPGHASGAAGGEGSGLIDIRSMANAYLGGSGGAAKPATSSAIGSIDDLPVFGGGGFSEPAVIVPTARAQAASSKMMYALIGSVALLAILGVILLVVVLTRDPKPAEIAAAGDPADKVKVDDTVAKKPDDTAAKPDDTAKKPDDTAAKKPDDTAKKPDDTAKKPDDTTTAVKKPDEPVKKPPAVKKDPVKRDPTTVAKVDPKPKVDPIKKDPKDTKPVDANTCDEVSCLLNNNSGPCCSKFAKNKPKTDPGPAVQIGEKPKSDLPAWDRNIINAGVGPVKGRIMACGDKFPAKGQVKVSVKVSADGAISSVAVTATPDPGLGNCVAAAMRGARFAKTQVGGSFAFPFNF